MLVFESMITAFLCELKISLSQFTSTLLLTDQENLMNTNISYFSYN